MLVLLLFSEPSLPVLLPLSPLAAAGLLLVDLSTELALSHSLAELCDAALNSPACSLCYKSGTAAFQGARASRARARQTEGTSLLDSAPFFCNYYVPHLCFCASSKALSLASPPRLEPGWPG